MSWNPFRKEPKAADPPAGQAAASEPVPPAATEETDVTDPLLEMDAGLLAETVEPVRAAGPVVLERVRLGAVGSQPFLRLRVLEQGELAQAINKLLLGLPEQDTGFTDLLVDGGAALAAKLSDAPLHLGEARRPQQVLTALAQIARLLVEAQHISGMAWTAPCAKGVLLRPAPADPAGLRNLAVQFTGWDGLGEACAQAPAALAKLGAQVCRARADAASSSEVAFIAGQFNKLAVWFDTQAEAGLDYAGLARACESVQPKLSKAWATDPGRKREHNEDACLIFELEQASSAGARLALAAVADGMGGHASGEVASHLALSLLRQHILGGLLAPRQSGPTPADLPVQLAGIIPAIDRALIERANLDDALAGMGTTLCGYAELSAQSTLGATQEQAITRVGTLLSVGDSRAYLLGADGAVRLSHDHSYVQQLVDSGAITAEEAFTHPQKNVITRCLGGSSTTDSKPDLPAFLAGPGDALLLCSDGLSDMLDDAAISLAVRETGLESLPALAAELVRRANAAGGNDNITVVLLRWEL